ncbi:L-aspartate 1-decarboxylase [Kitasatospora sp. SolWspMP-SS2h]|uniref:aspartate 1-decarboxylase n=1 Tax=Kitasatospora sp. SolWspMP-SS2h TaxID=1305729 RepID=UPI000DB90214|nr:aspartate 1-decarboxylase [Kitasatospora sp. SolWspMP-SS2h]RAJ29847.1 L-aspartate 1-decarboxylase [Kitasatospora sp. SolWspMP-SS2h]
MLRSRVHSLIHRATVTATGEGPLDAVLVDADVLAAADLQVGDRTTLTVVDAGIQLETYVLPAPPDSGTVQTFGAAAAVAPQGSRIVLTSHALLDEEQAAVHTPHMVFLTPDNRVHGAGGPVPPQQDRAGSTLVPRLPEPWALRVAEADPVDALTISQWMNAPHIAHAWGRAWPAGVWLQELARQRALGVSWPCFVSHRGALVGYIEIYRVVEDPYAGYIDAGPEDVGVHIALANPEERGRGRGPALLRAVSDALLDEGPRGRRVLAEPNATNAPALRAFEKAGFTRRAYVPIPQKTTALMVKEHRSPSDPAAR